MLNETNLNCLKVYTILLATIILNFLIKGI